MGKDILYWNQYNYRPGVCQISANVLPLSLYLYRLHRLLNSNERTSVLETISNKGISVSLY